MLRPLTALGLFSLLLGCASVVDRGEVSPPARARATPSPVYAQARQFGTILTSQLRRSPPRMGFTLDVHNRGATPVRLGLSAAFLASETPGRGRWPQARLTNNGPGELPGRLSADEFPPVDIILAPGQQQTLWVMFEAAPEPSSSGDPAAPPPAERLVLVLPLSPGPELILQLSDRAASPAFVRPPQRLGVSFASGVRLFNRQVMNTNQNLALTWMPYAVGLWYARGPWRGTLSSGGFDVVESIGDAAVHHNSRWLGLELQWVPTGWYWGAYTSSSLLFGDLQRTSWASDHPRLTGEAGISIVLAQMRGVPFSLKVGYIRVFDVPANRHGVALGLDLPVVWD